jgi:hypothetical protein
MTGVPTKLLGRQVLQQVLELDRTFVLKKSIFNVPHSIRVRIITQVVPSFLVLIPKWSVDQIINSCF